MQQLNPSEISDIIKQRIAKLDVKAQAQNEGTIVSVSDGIIRIHGLADVMYGEMIEFEGGVYGMALNLERDSVGAVVLGDYQSLAEGQTCRCTKRILVIGNCGFKVFYGNCNVINFCEQHDWSLVSTEMTKVLFANLFTELWVVNTHSLARCHAQHTNFSFVHIFVHLVSGIASLVQVEYL